MSTYEKIDIHNLKKIYSIVLFWTTRLSESLEGLNSSLAQLAGELWPLAKVVKVTFCGILIFTNFFNFEQNFCPQICWKAIQRLQRLGS